MKLLRSLASIFIDTFGITHPTPEARDRATRYISFLLLAVLLVLGVAIVVALHLIHN
jgi:hypothetical protein